MSAADQISICRAPTDGSKLAPKRSETIGFAHSVTTNAIGRARYIRYFIASAHASRKDCVESRCSLASTGNSEATNKLGTTSDASERVYATL